jgi:hypothetical protein
MGAGLTAAINLGGLVPDADKEDGWKSYRENDADSVIRHRRELAKNFWVD